MSDQQDGPPDSPAGGSFKFYEDEHRLDHYLKHRHQAVTSPNLVMEDPAFMAAIGDLAGKRVLDLGCGDGAFGAQCVEQDCASYLGIDGASGMIERAQQRCPDQRAHFEVADMATFTPQPDSVDLVASRLALHYLDDLSPTLSAARSALTTGGRLVVSVLHPVLTSGPTTPAGQRQDQIVDDYFSPGPRTREWFGAPVVWHHRTINGYIEAFRQAGLSLDGLSECPPVESLFGDNTDEFERRKRVPLFLMLAASPHR